MDMRDPDKAFENAITRGLEKPEDYMYMHSDKKYDYFKKIDTRHYIKFRNKKDPLRKNHEIVGELADHESECKGENYMDMNIRPHQKGDGGLLCMPLVRNLPDADKKQQDWEKVTCKICGEECWVSDAHKKILEEEDDIKAACTMCALKGGMGN